MTCSKLRIFGRTSQRSLAHVLTGFTSEFCPKNGLSHFSQDGETLSESSNDTCRDPVSYPWAANAEAVSSSVGSILGVCQVGITLESKSLSRWTAGSWLLRGVPGDQTCGDQGRENVVEHESKESKFAIWACGLARGAEMARGLVYNGRGITLGVGTMLYYDSTWTYGARVWKRGEAQTRIPAVKNVLSLHRRVLKRHCSNTWHMWRTSVVVSDNPACSLTCVDPARTTLFL